MSVIDEEVITRADIDALRRRLIPIGNQEEDTGKQGFRVRLFKADSSYDDHDFLIANDDEDVVEVIGIAFVVLEDGLPGLRYYAESAPVVYGEGEVGDIVQEIDAG